MTTIIPAAIDDSFAHLAHVPLPPGVDHVDGWQPSSEQPYRVLFTKKWTIDDHPARVWAVAVQYADGGIDIEGVSVEIAWEDLLTRAQTLQLVRAQMAAAEVIDAWAAFDGSAGR